MRLQQLMFFVFKICAGCSHVLKRPTGASNTGPSGSSNWVEGCALIVVGSIVVSRSLIAAETAEFEAFNRSFTNDIRPLLIRDCQKCHSDKVMEADIDLSIFTSITEVRKHPEIWQKIGEMLEGGQMPPKEEPQPTDAERTRMQQWIHNYLKTEAKSRAGDPGRVVLRRLNNFEYTNTVRDLTGVRTLTPAREFPVDSAAGEGFTNLGNALVVSPALITKFLDAGKEIADHAVLLPDGFRFSASTTQRDWTDELLAEIRGLYSKYTDSRGSTQVNIQGIVFDTNGGGRLPLDKYLEATLVERDALIAGRKSPESIAKERGLSPKYMKILWTALTGKDSTFLLDGLRNRWKAAKPVDAVELAAEIGRWQQALWRFTSVGHIGKVGGPKAWMEPVDPVTTRSEIRTKIPAVSDGQDISLYLTASDAGDGNASDFVVWEQPRLVAPGRPDLPLRDVREFGRLLLDRRDQTIASIVPCLNAVAEASVSQTKTVPADLAKRHNVDTEILTAWLDYLGVATDRAAKIENHFTEKINKSGGYDFINGYGSGATPLIVANSSDQHVRIPGNMKPHGVAVHPSPTLQAVIGWRSPIAATLRIEAKVQHAHPECGNGITWSLELRRGVTRQRLANGTAAGPKEVVVPPVENLRIQPDDVISLLIGPRDGNHGCDLTAVDMVLTSSGESSKTWDLARDLSPDIQAGNPHADGYGNQAVWHLYTESVTGQDIGAVVPAGSLLAQWQSSNSAEEKQKLATSIHALLTGAPPAAADTADAQLYWQLKSLGGPLFHSVRIPARTSAESKPVPATDKASTWGLDAAQFGHHPNGQAIDGGNICVKAPSVIEFKLPGDLVSGWELVTSATLHRETSADGTAQVQVLTAKPELASGLVPSSIKETNKNSQWTDNIRHISYSTPILVSEGSTAGRRVEAAFENYRNLFPAALCYLRIVPVDEVVTLTLFFREDNQLSRLMLDDVEAKRLDRLWTELHFVSQDALTLVDAFNQLMEYATQDADPKVFEPLRKPINDRAAAFRKELVDAEPKHVDKLIEFAGRAYRRPLKNDEVTGLRDLYRSLRTQELPHDEAIRFTLARVLVAPAFLYRVEPMAQSMASKSASPGQPIPMMPVNDWTLASRLSYFLWSTMPDEELRSLAAANRLHEPDVLVAQARRMLKDDRIRSLSTQFACQWLGVRDFDSHSEKSEQVFPTFTALRSDMYEESIRFFTDLFQRDGSVTEVLDSNHTFLNEALANHYGIPGVTGPEWRRVDNVKQYGRGGILTLATTLSQQSGASRTSPILRGNWVLETLLGEKLPKPPKVVPPLPETETDSNLTVRQLVEAHRSIESCAKCHIRIDAFGFSLEAYDAIGRRREKDLAGRPIEVAVELADGTKFSGETGLQNYLLVDRRNSFMRHFCRKLLGYSLARGVQLSDEPVLDEMMSQLKKNDYHFSTLVETIVRSQQFQFQRGNVEE